jgi:hypothetical protein
MGGFWRYSQCTAIRGRLAMGNGHDGNAFAPIDVRNGEHHGAWPVFCALLAAPGSLVAPEVRKPYD